MKKLTNNGRSERSPRYILDAGPFGFRLNSWNFHPPSSLCRRCLACYPSIHPAARRYYCFGWTDEHTFLYPKNSYFGSQNDEYNENQSEACRHLSTCCCCYSLWYFPSSPPSSVGAASSSSSPLSACRAVGLVSEEEEEGAGGKGSGGGSCIG